MPLATHAAATTPADAGASGGEAGLPLDTFVAHLATRQSNSTSQLVDLNIPPRPFAAAELNRRFWLLIGPELLVINGREVLRGARWAPGDLGRVIEAGLPDWRSRSGVEANAGLLLFDERLDVATATAAIKELRTARRWPFTALFRDVSQTDQLAEFALLPSDTTPN